LSCEEHLVENIISYIQNTGSYKVEKGTEKYEEFYNNYSKNGDVEISKEVFDWLVEMANYVVYEATVCNTDFSDYLHKEGIDVC